MFAIEDAKQLALISGGPAGGGGPPGAPGWSSYSYGFSEIGYEGGPPAVVTIGPPKESSSDHAFVDGAMIGAVGRFAGVAATGFAEGFLVGAGATAYAGPAAIAFGLVAGFGTAYAATELLKWDHARVNYQ